MSAPFEDFQEELKHEVKEFRSTTERNLGKKEPREMNERSLAKRGRARGGERSAGKGNASLRIAASDQSSTEELQHRDQRKTSKRLCAHLHPSTSTTGASRH